MVTGRLAASARRRRGGPVSTAIFGVILAAIAVGLFVFSFNVRSQGARSAYTQAHGVAQQATVVSVTVTQQQQNNPGTTTARPGFSSKVIVMLSQPVGGQSQTTVNVPQLVTYKAGDPINVLVDPQQPGYAELPGTPDVTSSDSTAFLIAAIVVAALTVLFFLRVTLGARGRRRDA